MRSLCQQLSVSTKEDKVALKELFPNLVKNGHSNPEISKMIKEIGEAKVSWKSAKLLELKIKKKLGQFTFASVKQPDIIESVTKGLLSSNGPESEAGKIKRNWENLQSEVKLCDPKKVILDLYKASSDQRELCFMMGLYLSKDFELLRAPHSVFNHFVRLS